MPAKIMIVDDEPDIRMYLEAVLEDGGYQTCGLGEGKSILEFVSEQKPDLIVLDIMMPKRSGVSVYKALRASEDFKYIPVIIISGMMPTRDLIEEEFNKLIAEDSIPPPEGFVEKPIKLPALMELIEELSGQ